ncbi:hypothetical protein [Brevundimonas sp. M20]|uniref:hypothetical protein n=1 Tax=Brevundimonas sp. M20 TaxID=2591463 RepID=UPI001146B753|nr:hypothetical protein [Brevundimonas sp. M20]QDH74354.1 hypothetical protein FKQ52_13560 [Brevundimonas sp. M20]
MAKRRMRVDRLITVLGGAVILLGVLLLWLVSRNVFSHTEPTPEERAQTQVHALVGPAARVTYTETGRRRAVCGYLRNGDDVVAFVSRPNRLMLETDPLKTEFEQNQSDLCPGFLKRRGDLPR